MFRIGASTMFAETKGFEYLIKILEKGLEITIIEYYDEGPMFLDTIKIEKLKRIKREFGYSFGVHAPYLSINPASISNGEYMYAREKLIKSIDHAVELDASYIIFHPGNMLNSQFKRHRYREAKERNLSLLCELGELSQEHDVQPQVENMHNKLSIMRTASETAEFLRSCRLYRLAFDIPHAYLVGDINNYFSGIVRKAGCIHLSDNDGSKDLHLPLGYGVIPWDAYLSKLWKIGFRGPIIIENRNFTDVMISYRLLKQHLY